jgi:hypothetical protein
MGVNDAKWWSTHWGISTGNSLQLEVVQLGVETKGDKQPGWGIRGYPHHLLWRYVYSISNYVDFYVHYLGYGAPTTKWLLYVIWILSLELHPQVIAIAKRHWGYDLPNNLRIWDIMKCVKYNYSTWFWTHINGETEVLDHWIWGL